MAGKWWTGNHAGQFRERKRKFFSNPLLGTNLHSFISADQ
jgi:hypothetical protein